MKCLKCGAPLDKDAGFCENCGTAVQKKKSRMGLIIGLLAGAVVLVGGGSAGGILLYQHQQEKHQQELAEKEKLLEQERRKKEAGEQKKEKESEPAKEADETDPKEDSAENLQVTGRTIQAGSYVSVTYPVLQGGAYAEAVQRMNAQWKEEAETLARDMQTEMDGVAAELKKSGITQTVPAYTREITDTYVQDGKISVALSEFTYSGGAHGTTYSKTYNYDLEAGRELTMEDWLECSKETATEAVVGAFARNEAVVQGAVSLDTVREQLGDASYWMKEDGLHVMFQQYSVGAYALGMPHEVVTQADVEAAASGQKAGDTALQNTGIQVEICYGILADTRDFIFPYSSTRELTDEDLKVLEAETQEQEHSNSQMAINEILARYGYTFRSSSSTGQEAWEKFSGLGWYQEAQLYCGYTKSGDLIADMNAVEKANIAKINEWQKAHGCYY